MKRLIALALLFWIVFATLVIGTCLHAANKHSDPAPVPIVVPIVQGYTVNVQNGHVLMLLEYDLAANISYSVQTSEDLQNWTTIDIVPATGHPQTFGYSLDLTSGTAVIVRSP